MQICIEIPPKLNPPRGPFRFAERSETPCMAPQMPNFPQLYGTVFGTFRERSEQGTVKTARNSVPYKR